MRRQPPEYPQVRTEMETLDAILEGKSIARYGDGEFNHVRGGKNVSQTADPKLQQELTRILTEPYKRLIVGIPTMIPGSPRYFAWSKYAPGYAVHLNGRMTYYSSFITRPDNAPWINTPEFFDKIESLWKDQYVTLVANGERSLKPQFLHDTGAKDVFFVQCAYSNCYAQIDELEMRVVEQGAARALLCCGPTATALAARLARRGIHAIDLGHIGMFWRMYARTKKPHVEQREINKDTGAVEPNP